MYIEKQCWFCNHNAYISQVRPELEEKSERQFEMYIATLYRSQLVAGTNFFIKVRTFIHKYCIHNSWQLHVHAACTMKVAGISTVTICMQVACKVGSLKGWGGAKDMHL